MQFFLLHFLILQRYVKGVRIRRDSIGLLFVVLDAMAVLDGHFKDMFQPKGLVRILSVYIQYTRLYLQRIPRQPA